MRTALQRSLLAATVVASMSALPIGPAIADHTPLPERVTLMGSLMSELGCESDWSETCSLTDPCRFPVLRACSPGRS